MALSALGAGSGSGTRPSQPVTYTVPLLGSVSGLHTIILCRSADKLRHVELRAGNSTRASALIGVPEPFAQPFTLFAGRQQPPGGMGRFG